MFITEKFLSFYAPYCVNKNVCVFEMSVCVTESSLSINKDVSVLMSCLTDRSSWRRTEFAPGHGLLDALAQLHHVVAVHGQGIVAA